MISDNKIMSLITNRFLELIILPTEQCNFRCTYCYEDFLIGKMKENVVNAIKKLIKSRISDLDTLKISWFGGEPLAAKDIVFDISSYILELKQAYPGLKYVSGMTTNAFMLNQVVFANLIKNGVTGFQISLDGTEEQHNKTRVRMNGQGSFKNIWNNLLGMKETSFDFTAMIRLHVTPDNINDIYKLIDQLKVSFGNDARFRIFIKAIENLGGPNSGTFKTITGKDKSEILKGLNEHLGSQIGSFDMNSNGPYVCYAAQTNSLVVRANGALSKCTVAFSDERNAVGFLRDDGTVQLNGNMLSLWTRGLKSGNLSELKCPMYMMPKIATSLQSIPVRIEG